MAPPAFSSPAAATEAGAEEQTFCGPPFPISPTRASASCVLLRPCDATARPQSQVAETDAAVDAWVLEFLAAAKAAPEVVKEQAEGVSGPGQTPPAVPIGPCCPSSACLLPAAHALTSYTPSLHELELDVSQISSCLLQPHSLQPLGKDCPSLRRLTLTSRLGWKGKDVLPSLFAAQVLHRIEVFHAPELYLERSSLMCMAGALPNLQELGVLAVPAPRVQKWTYVEGTTELNDPIGDLQLPALRNLILYGREDSNDLDECPPCGNVTDAAGGALLLRAMPALAAVHPRPLVVEHCVDNRYRRVYKDTGGRCAATRSYARDVLALARALGGAPGGSAAGCVQVRVELDLRSLEELAWRRCAAADVDSDGSNDDGSDDDDEGDDEDTPLDESCSEAILNITVPPDGFAPGSIDANPANPDQPTRAAARRLAQLLPGLRRATLRLCVERVGHPLAPDAHALLLRGASGPSGGARSSGGASGASGGALASDVDLDAMAVRAALTAGGIVAELVSGGRLPQLQEMEIQIVVEVSRWSNQAASGPRYHQLGVLAAEAAPLLQALARAQGRHPALRAVHLPGLATQREAEECNAQLLRGGGGGAVRGGGGAAKGRLVVTGGGAHV